MAMKKARVLGRQPPAPGGVCLLGSSTFTFWEAAGGCAESLGLPVYNAAFGGSKTHHVSAWVPKLVEPHAPRTVVVYVGVNDLMAGRPHSQVAEDIVELLRTLQGTPLVYLGIFASPLLRQHGLADAVREVNSAVSGAGVGVYYVDPNAERFVHDESCYQDDMLHLNAAGYAHLGSLLRPVVRHAFGSTGTTT
jgi:lysophospholipase L1-like esterase